jgi:minimal PKS acyl carrier protein
VAKEFTIEDLKRILTQAAGDAGEDLADGDILDVGFEELGYDSLALLEAGSRIEREFGTELDESTLTDADTPRALVEAVNEQLGVHHVS